MKERDQVVNNATQLQISSMVPSITEKNPKKRKAQDDGSRSNKRIVIAPNRHAIIGAPSQQSQPSRKGKRAWRKNVDIGEVEEKLEGLREEERILGGPLKDKPDSELFLIDTVGDEKLRQTLRIKKPLTSTLVLSQRSAVPAVFSKPEISRSKPVVTSQEKARLLRIAKRTQRGPFNAVIDPTESGHGSALLEPSGAVRHSGRYNIWAESGPPDRKVAKVLRKGEAEDFIGEIINKPDLKAPTTAIREVITAPAVSDPHRGTSYNPPQDAYSELLEKAIQAVQKQVAEEDKHMDIKEAMEAARHTLHIDVPRGAEGMTIDTLMEDTAEDPINGEGEEVIEVVPTKILTRKTKQQRQKARKVLAERRMMEDRLKKKRLLATVDRVKFLKADVETARTEQERKAAERLLERAEGLRKGLAGRRWGKYTVPVERIDVQLGEDLRPSLRELKVEGNLFKDRFLSMQNRALIEPRVRVLPKRRKRKVKELEKFAWKRFE